VTAKKACYQFYSSLVSSDKSSTAKPSAPEASAPEAFMTKAFVPKTSMTKPPAKTDAERTPPAKPNT